MILFRKFSIYHSCQAQQKSIWTPLWSSLYWSIAINILVLLTRILRGLASSCRYQRARSQQPLISVTIVTITHPKLSHIDFPHKCLVVRLFGLPYFLKNILTCFFQTAHDHYWIIIHNYWKQYYCHTNWSPHLVSLFLVYFRDKCNDVVSSEIYPSCSHRNE